MREAASQVLLERAGHGSDLRRPLALSVGAHRVGSDPLVSRTDGVPLDLGGADVGDEERHQYPMPSEVLQDQVRRGLTPMGGRPIQEVVPLPEKPDDRSGSSLQPTRPRSWSFPSRTRHGSKPQSDVRDCARRGARTNAEARTAAAGWNSDGRHGTHRHGTRVVYWRSWWQRRRAERVDDFCCPEYLSNDPLNDSATLGLQNRRRQARRLSGSQFERMASSTTSMSTVPAGTWRLTRVRNEPSC